ncbi:MAG TPA: hypothetical protein VKB50_22750 [Vicinamibacterales bacterium]|nr:hypothetical protein [Vicinamibacterales bacterium]
MFGMPELLIMITIASMGLVVVWPAGRICRRAGFSPWLGLLAIVPLVSLVLLWFIAYADWPSQRVQTRS